MANKKYDINTLKKIIEDEGYILLSDTYISLESKLLCICPNGHEYRFMFGNWISGYRCKLCADNNRRLSLEKIRSSFEKENYILLTTDYINNKQKLIYMCPKGHTHSIKWNDWQHGKRCYYCHGNLKPTIAFVKKSFEEDGYILLSKEYTNSKTKLNYICPKGHAHSITWSDWSAGYRCATCAGNIMYSIEFVKLKFKEEGYTILSDEYKNAHTKLDYVCPNGHKHSITWGNWRTGYRCPVCKGINLSISRTGPGHPNWQGGISFEPYCEVWKDQEYKKDIRERDGNVCLNPYCYHTDQMLSIHHIDYDKKNCHPKNLITVCRSCNSRANTDRGWHKSWYQAVLNRRYGYEYRKI